MKELINDAIKNILDIQPYKFEDLKNNMWVWDDVKMKFIKIALIGNKTIYVEDEIGEFDCYCKFEENRFYPVTKAMQYQEELLSRKEDSNE